MAAGPPFSGAGMAKDDSQADVHEENRQLRQALRECRELLERTEAILKRAHRSGGPQQD